MELILFNKAVNTEAELNDLKLFSSSDDDFSNSMNQIDLLNPLEKKSYSKRYDQINISSSLLENDIQENFNFKNILSN
jgi:hypothetical protein